MNALEYSKMLTKESGFRRLLVLLWLSIICAFPLSAKTYVFASQIITATSDSVLNDHSLVIEQGVITAITPGRVEPKTEPHAEFIDLTGYTLMPGLMDMHVHLSYQQSGTSAYLKRFTQNPADLALQAAHYAEKTLLAGFTTVRNLGDSFNETAALRNAINQGITVGPRIFTAGKSLATTGGHADPTNGFRDDLGGDPGPEQGVLNGANDARKAVRERYKQGADLIKITATGGVLSVAKSGQNPQFMDDELAAVVSTAKDYGMTVAVHAHGTEGMKRAVEAGVNSIEHGTYMSDEVMQLMKQNQVYFVPTILAGKFVADKAKVDGYFPDIVRPKAATIGPLIQQTFARAYRAGVPIAFGTDSGVSAHGDNAQEFALMVEVGMTPMEAIRSATYHAAKLLNEPRLGTLSEGNVADMIAVKGDPLSNIRLLETVDFVMKDGVVYKRPQP